MCECIQWAMHFSTCDICSPSLRSNLSAKASDRVPAYSGKHETRQLLTGTTIIMLQVGHLTPLKDDEQVDVFAPSIPIYEGFNIVGRCNIDAASKQVSRKHINVRASSNNIFELIVEGQNPVILRSGSQRHKLCPQSKVAFNVGDVIELLPGKHKFKLTAASNMNSDSEKLDFPIETDDSKNVEGVMLKRKRQEMEDESFAQTLQAITDSSSRHVLLGGGSSTIWNSKEKLEEYGCRVDENLDVIGNRLEKSSSNFQLLRVRGLPDWANSGCVSIQDVIQGDVLVAMLSNYMVDVDWLLSACPLLKHVPQVVVIHGESGGSLDLLKTTKPSRWILHKPPLRLSYGTHHSKAMILIYATGIRVVVHTANLIYVDWNNKTQGLWMQDFPYKTESQSGNRSPFENDLVEYLEALEWSGCTVNFPQIGTVKVDAVFFRRFDYSSASVRLVASVPGYHQGNKLNKWGHMKLRNILEEQYFGEDFVQAPLVYQFSSLGSLDEKWLREFQCSMSAGCTFEKKPLGLGKFQIVWPTVEDVRWSLEGYAAGNAIPSPLKNVEKGFLQKYWARWMADHSGRSRAMPHIKTFARYNGQCLAWFLLTSANLSKAAWGALQKNESQIMIRSYELGVLFLPSLVKNIGKQFSCTNHLFQSEHGPQVAEISSTFKDGVEGSVNYTSEGNISLVTMLWNSSKNKKLSSNVIQFPVPYRLPPQNYAPNDIPWSWDRQYHQPDACGEVWPRPVHLYGSKET